MLFAAILAQANELITAQPALYTYGPMGIMLGWFMWRNERLIPEIRTLSHRIDGLTKALLMDMISRDTSGPHTIQQAREALAKIAARTVGDKG